MDKYVGKKVIMKNLADDSLNGIELRVTRFRAPDRIVVDATPPEMPPGTVRHVSVPIKKVAKHIPPEFGEFEKNILIGVQATNKAVAFARAGLSVEELACVKVTPHPDVRRNYSVHDVPLLVDKFNERDGGGWSSVFGFHVFALESTRKTGPTEALYTTEMTVLARDPRGALIDLAPDLACGRELQYKLFVPDPALSPEKISTIGKMIDNCADMQWTNPAIKFEGDEGDEKMSMLPQELCQEIEIDETNIKMMIWPFSCDSGFTDDNHVSKTHFAQVYKMRRDNPGMAVGMSRALALKVLEEYALPEDGFFVHRDQFLDVCYGCHTRCTPEELTACAGCEVATYCSPHCRKTHWFEAHRKCCASAGERRQKKAAKAEAERHVAALKRAHDERESSEAAAEAAAEAERRLQVAKSRLAAAEAKQAAIDARVRAAALPAVAARSSKKNKSKKTKSTEEELLHAAWDSNAERLARRQAFDAKQETEHLEKEARVARARADALRKLEADASAAKEAVEHVVPAPATIADVLSATVPPGSHRQRTGS